MALHKVRRALLIDGYLDEPACFGVPPYISPLARYCFGALAAHFDDVAYITADEWRRDRERAHSLLAEADVSAVIAGLTVPGRYRGGSPLTMREMTEIASLPRRGVLFFGGPVMRGYVLRGGMAAKKIVPDGVDMWSDGDIDESLARYLASGEWDASALRTYETMQDRSVRGAAAARQHPNWPDVIAEIDISYGCDRIDGRCSFCTEGLLGAYRERGVRGTADEIEALHAAGVRAFRFGRCANILAYGADMTPRGARPNAIRLHELYSAARSAAPDLTVLHTDNCNPATVARFPDESARAVEVISRMGTEGDCLSLGVESADPAVVRANCLKVDADGAYLAVRVINEAGGWRKTPRGLPSLLPGLNFLFGLNGETKDTAALDRAFLERLLDDGLAVRRINIRRAMVFDSTPLGSSAGQKETASRLKERDAARWRDWVREEVDPEMLRRVAPDGTIVRRVIIEERRGAVAFGRPLGSYPPLVGVVSPDLKPGDKLDVAVTSHGSRSITAVRSPLDIATVSRSELEALPEIGRARANTVISMRETCADEKKILEALDAPGICDRLKLYFESEDRPV